MPMNYAIAISGMKGRGFESSIFLSLVKYNLGSWVLPF